ncbi:hypothetical protein Vretimale_2090 [Volvox reticuliferus]|uniref:Uncharacterized protein n=1 Tax=Volvox reticuliferus TaxID=1737510 RepID=A0A8J4D5T2_9CHLO|nr:hypothetical protein Vretifemale_4300 [Volvox reticuliferus]GIL96230.1 hypothetical protein Vretimale_2090 [Volvox reticuliferus]
MSGGAAAQWLPILLLLKWASLCKSVQVPHHFSSITELLATKDILPREVAAPVMLDGMPAALPEDVVSLVGWGSTLPDIFLYEEWDDIPFNPSNDTAGVIPPVPTLPSAPRMGDPLWFTALDWRHIKYRAIRLLPGQRLQMKSMAFYMVDSQQTVAGQLLSQLSFSPIELPAGAVLELEDIVIILGCIELRLLQQALCSSPDTWSYNPGVTVEDGVMRITNMTSRAPGPANGVPGAGGQVNWLNVTLRCLGFGLQTPRPCAARAVANGWELYTAARKALVDESATTVILSITEDVALPTENGIWEPVPLRPEQQLALLGDPSRPAPTQLDVSGMADAWRLESMTIPAAVTRPLVQLYDVLLVNMPYPVRPNGPMSLLAASLPCFGITRGYLGTGAEQLHLIRSTVVVPDPEVDFLAGAAGLDSNEIWPGQPPGSFTIMINKQNISYTSMESNGSAVPQLAVSKLKLMSEVLMTDCMLMSASSYQQRPGAIPLLPQLSAWLPELMTIQDPTVGQWGPGGLAMFLGLQQALADLARCDSLPGYTASRRIWRQHDTSVPPLESANSSTAPLSITLSTNGALTSTATCAVDGSLMLDTTSSPPRPLHAGGGRVFSDLKGAIKRFSLVRPITLRNMVLYNLAPGGAYPTSLTRWLPPSLRPSDAAWANSSLPLWFFDCARSDADLTYRPTVGELTSLSPNETQQRQIDTTYDMPSLQLPPRLVLENITLVISEREWRAMVAVVLLTHAPDAMRELQLQPRKPPSPPLPSPPPAPPFPYSGPGTDGSGDTFTPSSPWWPDAPNLPPFALGTYGEPPDIPMQPNPPPGLPFFPEPPPPSPPVPFPKESPPSPPSPSPSPWAPPSPPYVDTTHWGLRSFAAASKVLSYNYHAGELVLAVARHYGWRGINVTITYKLPADAPAGATLLSYPELILPYDDLADMEIGLLADFSQSPTPAPAPAPTAAPGPKPHTSDPSQLTATTSDGPDSAQWTAPPIADASSPASPSNAPAADRHSWLVPVVVCTSVVGGILVLSALLIVFVFRQKRRGSGGVNVFLPAHNQGQLITSDYGKSVHNGRPTVSGMEAANQQEHQKQQPMEVAVMIDGNHSPQRDTPAGPGEPARIITPNAQSRIRTSTAEANWAALVQILTRGQSTPDPFSAARPGSSLLVDLLKQMNNGDGCGSSPQGGEAPPPATAANDVRTQTFLRELDNYVVSMLRSTTGEEVISKGSGTHPSTLVQPQVLQGVADAIQALQAELRDPDLHVEAMIGCGSFGVVYRGTWRGLPVAVKTMVVATEPDGSREGRQARQRAVLEAAISLSMAHPNVVVTYSYDLKPLVQAPTEASDGADVPTWRFNEASVRGSQNLTVHGHQGNDELPETCDAVKLYIVQEYCNCGTLRGALDGGMAGCIRAGGLAGMLARGLALDVALGMQHIHSCRIVHGDLKPENVLLVWGRQPEADSHSLSVGLGRWDPFIVASSASASSAMGHLLTITAKVADFGLSTPLAEGATHASKIFHGTPTYVAPEVTNAGRQSTRADVWSFGVMLIELFFGCSLHQVLDIYSAARGSLTSHQQGLQNIVLKDLTACIPDPDYAALVERCLTLEPRERPDFGELVATLQTGFS